MVADQTVEALDEGVFVGGEGADDLAELAVGLTFGCTQER